MWAQELEIIFCMISCPLYSRAMTKHIAYLLYRLCRSAYTYGIHMKCDALNLEHRNDNSEKLNNSMWRACTQKKCSGLFHHDSFWLCIKLFEWGESGNSPTKDLKQPTNLRTISSEFLSSNCDTQSTKNGPRNDFNLCFQHHLNRQLPMAPGSTAVEWGPIPWLGRNVPDHSSGVTLTPQMTTPISLFFQQFGKWRLDPAVLHHIRRCNKSTKPKSNYSTII